MSFYVYVWMSKRVRECQDAVWGVKVSSVVSEAPEDSSPPSSLPPPPFFSPLTLISSSVRSTMLGRNVSLTEETKIMFMGSSSTEIIFHISATAWALWGSKFDFLLPVPMGNIMGKKTDWIVREMAWRSCGRPLLCLGVLLCACMHVYHERGRPRQLQRGRESKIKIRLFSVHVWMSAWDGWAQLW